jgi:hypothetical protein
VWQKSSWCVDWQSAPYSQNQNSVESKIEALFARGVYIKPEVEWVTIHVICIHDIYGSRCNELPIWTKAINMAPITAMYRYIAHISDFMPPGAKMFCYKDDSLRLKGEDHQEIMWYCGRPRTGGGFLGFNIEKCKVYVRNRVNFGPRFLYIDCVGGNFERVLKMHRKAKGWSEKDTRALTDGLYRDSILQRMIRAGLARLAPNEREERAAMTTEVVNLLGENGKRELAFELIKKRAR